MNMKLLVPSLIVLTSTTLAAQSPRQTRTASPGKKVVKRVEGVSSVDNQIEVLPLSPDDDRIRMAAHRAIFSQARWQRYQLSAVPPIHIIVENGSITLEGAV